MSTPASPPFPAAVAMAPAARTVKQREAHDALQHKANKRARKAAKQQQQQAAAEEEEGDDAAADAAAAAEAEEAAAVAAAAAATAEAELALMRAAEFGGDDSDDDDSSSSGDSDADDSDNSDVDMTPATAAPEGEGEASASAAVAVDSDDDDDDDDDDDLHAQQRAAEEEARISRRAAGGGKGPAYFAAMAKQMAEEEKAKAAAAASKARAAATRSPRRGPTAPVPTNRATRIEPCDPTKIVQGERLLHCGVQREVISGDCKVALVLNSKGFPDWTNLPQGECAHILTKIVGADVSDDASLESFVWGKDSTTLIVVPHTHGVDLAKAALRVPTAKPAIKEGWVRAGVQNVPPHSSIFKTTLPMSTLRVLRAVRNGSAPPPEDADEAAQRKADRAAMAAAATLPMTPSGGADISTTGAAAAAAAPAAATAAAAAPAAATSVTGSRKRKAPGGGAAAAASGPSATGSNGAPSHLPLLSAAARNLVDRVIEPELRRRAQASGIPLESEFVAFFRATEETFNRNVPSEQPDPLAARIQAMWNRENKDAEKDVGEFVKWQLARVMLLVDPASNRYLHELRNKCIVEDSANVDYSRCI